MIILEIILFLSLFAALYFGGAAIYESSAGLQTGVANISLVFNMIVGNMKNLNQVFPVYDLCLAFGAVIVIEGIMILLKIAKLFIKFKSQK